MTNSASDDKGGFLSWLTGKYPQLSGTQAKHLLDYGDLLRDATERMGIVSRGDKDRLFSRHIRESLEPALGEAMGHSWRVLDVGSGGGLPGIPLGIVRPDLHVTMLEARSSKVAFLERVKLTLGLENVFVRGGRMEELNGSVTGVWNCAISRSVKWNPAMIRSLRECVAENGFLVRFGAPTSEASSGVKIVPLEGSSERAVQFWPPNAWDALPNAR